MSSRRFNFYRPTSHQHMTPLSLLQDPSLYEKNMLSAGYGYGGQSGTMSAAFTAGPQVRSNSEDQLELHHHRTAMERAQHKCSDLEGIVTELEKKLEERGMQQMALERDCLTIQFEWEEDCRLLNEEIGKWKREYESERKKNDKTEKELYGILYRKHSMNRSAAVGRGGSAMKAEAPHLSGARKSEEALHLAIGSAYDTNSLNDSQKSREKKVISELSDFLGL